MDASSSNESRREQRLLATFLVLKVDWKRLAGSCGNFSRYPRQSAKILSLGTQMLASLSIRGPRLSPFKDQTNQQLQPWVAFTAREKVLAPRPSHSRDPYLPGSRAAPTTLSNKSASSQERVPRRLKLALFSEIAMELPKSKSSLV